MYELRFNERIPDELTLKQIRGHEGVRVREVYAKAAREAGIVWAGRSYNTGSWRSADPVNRALSVANASLYGVCMSAIIAAGYSPAIRFIHTGKSRSFVYDIADLYKTALSIPVAFSEAARGGAELESRVRRACRDAYAKGRLLERVIPDIEFALSGARREAANDEAKLALWDPELGDLPAGSNYAESDA
jgi:CRISPR-associated protein Cas1